MTNKEIQYIIENGTFPIEVSFYMSKNSDGKTDIIFDIEEIEYEFMKLKFALTSHNSKIEKENYFNYCEDF